MSQSYVVPPATACLCRLYRVQEIKARSELVSRWAALYGRVDCCYRAVRRSGGSVLSSAKLCSASSMGHPQSFPDDLECIWPHRGEGWTSTLACESALEA
ncbi:uncharacterized protein L969DRAFT_105942 [Mixia osmundae IAM 14324]|uniref:Uncharacterized protein n=1 Tax=Mixia osmundae (strain CBS 9802 / IAM 14324 / JCM 22182 / KY 12970) TaxID=764103 RepID=G7EB62_MIXOS|nr:uncharacterized protein L969DRAFT_105942 [Mixia osmundae IAM 14324]KEI36560.1 hypothetical protein L969DRAFT_105942 [Mixia osmundae IAM 14324]GAB00073.1 hypothetical protein E5Q_06775 [Mixia osmundae IAM 14324]